MVNAGQRTARGVGLVATVAGLGVGAGLAVLPTVTTCLASLTDDSTAAPDRALASAVVLLGAAVLVAAWAWTLACVALCVAEATCPGAPVFSSEPSLLRPRLVRALVVVTLGAVVLSAPAAAHAEESLTLPGSLRGLPLPDRTVGPAVEVRTTGVTEDVHRVRNGDSLWRIAERLLPPRSAPAQVDQAWRALYRANRAAIGPDPALIHPGVELRVPPSSTGDRP